MEPLDDALREAETCARACQWGAAALAYARAAERAEEHKQPAVAVRALEAAGESWRRDDRPISSARALSLALRLVGDRPQAVTIRLKLAGALAELGRTTEAAAACAEALRTAPPGPLRAVAVDTAFEAALTQGRVEDARALFLELECDSKPELQMARFFREGQLLRCAGELVRAGICFGQVVAEAEPFPEAAPARAAAEGELAEVALLRGDIPDAIALFDRSKEHFAEAGRRALTWRVEAGRVRAAVAGGLQPLLLELNDGVSFAQTREMRVLEVDLRIARAVATAGTDAAAAAQDFNRAIAEADDMGHPWRAGRARVERARRTRGPDVERLAELRRAEKELSGSAPWVARAILGQARASASTDRRGATLLAASALARLSAMDMERDAEEARLLLQELR